MSDPVLKGASILILEDELLLRKHLVAVLEQQDADVTAIGTVDEARRVVGSLSFDFALLDLHLPDGLGTDLLKEGIFSPNTAVIVCTAEGGIKSAVEAIKNGAQDYLLKPIDSSVLPMILQKAKTSTRSARLVEHERRNPNKTGEQIYFGNALSDFKNKLEKITAVDERLGSQLPPVLIHGETGTGKTSIARWLHHNGPRRDSQLVEVNCPALPENLAESELFGHERGAFTDAKSARMGLFEAANGGTLFLDELPSLSLGIQAKILKTIEDRSIRRLGGNREIEVDVRIIAASNQDLGQAVKKGKFRDDLHHRLSLFLLTIPPLRDRGGDILKLAKHLLEKLCQRHQVKTKPISTKGQARLLSHPWRGNVRELNHELERTIVFEDGDEWEFSSLPARNENNKNGNNNELINEKFNFPKEGFSLEETIGRIIQHAITQSGGNVSAAARLLDVPRDYIRYRQKNSGK
tara:strand:+ start:5830 stop:7224 length:1395 start_codon:yes stop_codon:yes gene_type:complete